VTESPQHPTPAPSTDPSTLPEPMPQPLPPPPAIGPEVAGDIDPIVARAWQPQVGELSPGWRIATFGIWLAVILAFAAIWNTSVQLGLSTWWLGPRADPQPRPIRLSPFIGPALMLLGTINQVKWLAWFGLAASGVLAGYGIADLGRVSSIAAVELIVAGLAAIASLASLSGTYRSDPAAVATHQTESSRQLPA
jgi:hypothetical protein